VNHPSEVLEIGQNVRVKVLDIDRDRQRISLGLKQTQTDPWQQVLESYGEGDVVEGKVTKVVTFGAFVEILAGVEGLVHISELAQHHVENPRDVVSSGQTVNVLILEVDAERRRLSLSMKRVQEGQQPRPKPGEEGEELGAGPNLDLSEDVFTDDPAAVAETAPEAEAAVELGDEADPAALVEAAAPADLAEVAAPAEVVEAADVVEALAPAEVEAAAPADVVEAAPQETADEASLVAPEVVDEEPEPVAEAEPGSGPASVSEAVAAADDDDTAPAQ
jgi:small subunit ribosomal protein S1